MSRPVRLPDAMPEIKEPTLFVVCGNHGCRFVGAKGRILFEEDVFRAKELEYSDRETQLRGPSGITSGSGGDRNLAEQNRMREYTHSLVTHVEKLAREQGIRAIYLAAPDRVLSAIKDHLTPAVKKLLKSMVNVNIMQESPLELLERFMPEAVEAVRKLRDQENFSAKKQPPRK